MEKTTFSLGSMLSNTKESAIRRMKSGIAVLTAIAFQVSRSGHATAKFVFDSITGNGGHDEFVRTSTAQNLVKSIGKLIYAIKLSGNKEVIARVSLIQLPITTVVDEKGNPVTFTKNEELEDLRAKYGEDLDWVWSGKDSNDRTAVMVGDREAFINELVEACQPLVGTKYLLKISPAKDGETFQNLDNISASK